MTFASAVFASSVTPAADLLRLVLVIGTALTGGLILREVLLRWHDRSVLVIIAAVVVLGAPVVIGEVRAVGQPPTLRLPVCVVGLALVAFGLVRARTLRRTVRAAAVQVAETRPRVTSYTIPGDRAIGVARTAHVSVMPQRVLATRPDRTRGASGPVHLVRLR